MTENFYTIYTPDRRTYGGELTTFDFEGHHTLETMANKIIKAERFDAVCRNNIKSRDRNIGRYWYIWID